MSEPIRYALGPAARHWQRVPLKRAVDINQRTLSEDTDPDYTFRYIDIASVRSDGSLTELRELRFGEAPSRARRMVRAGDVVVSTVRTYLRAIARVPDIPEDLICSTGFAVLSARPEVDPGFLYWWTRCTPFIEDVVARSSGVSYPAVAPEDLGRIPTPIPPLHEQQAICRFLDRETAHVDAVLRARKRLDELLTERFRASAARRLLHEVDPTTDRADELPRGWRSARLATVVKLQRGHDLPDHVRRDGGVPIVSSGGITGYHDEPVRLGPGVITGRYGTVGEVFWLEGPYWPLNTSLYVADFRGNDPRWVYHLLRVLPLNVDAEKSAVTGINRNVVGELRVPLPPPEEQRRLARSLDDTEQDVTVARAATRKHLQLLKERRQALITAAVTGVNLPNQAA